MARSLLTIINMLCTSGVQDDVTFSHNGTYPNNIETVKSCQYYFNFKLPSLLWSERVKKFDNKYDLFTGSLFTV